MQKQVSTPAMVAVILVVIALLGLIGWQVFGSHTEKVDPTQSNIIKARKDKDG